VWERLGMVNWEWPSNSPDLNLIEHVWSYIKDIIARNYAHVSSAKEMNEIIFRIWEKFTDNWWDKLLKSISEKMVAAIAAQSKLTRF